MLLEAARMLQFSKEEFISALEWNTCGSNGSGGSDNLNLSINCESQMRQINNKK